MANNVLGYLTARGAELPAGEYARYETLTVSGGNRYAVKFDDTTAQQLIWTLPRLPGSYQGGDMVLTLQCIAATATSGNVRMTCEVEAISAGDAVDLDGTSSFDTANTQTTAVAGTAGYLFSVPITLIARDSANPGDLLRLRVKRDAANGADTATGDLRVLGAVLTETVDILDLTGYSGISMPPLYNVTISPDLTLNSPGLTGSIVMQAGDSGYHTITLNNYNDRDNDTFYNQETSFLYLDNDGSIAYVGIGGPPDAPLHITSTAGNQIRITGTTTGYVSVDATGTEYKTSGTSHRHSVGGTVYHCVSASGVGLGTTSPTARLDVRTGATTTVGQVVRGESSQTADLSQWQTNGGTVVAAVTSDGRIGVGTSPVTNSTLHIKMPGTKQGFIVTNGDSTGTQTWFGFTTGSGPLSSGNDEYTNYYKDANGWIWNTSKGGTGTIRRMRWTVDGTTAFVIDTNNRVGVGNNLTPQAALDIRSVGAGVMCLAIRGTTGQSSNLLTCQNVGGTTVAAISAAGDFTGTLGGCTGLPISGISATGTPTDAVFLRGDGTWSVPVFGVNLSDNFSVFEPAQLIQFSGRSLVDTGGGIPRFRTALSHVTVSGTSDTLDVMSDGCCIHTTNGSAVTLTLGSTAPVDTYVEVVQTAAGQVTFSPGSGATLHNRQSHTKTAGQWAVVRLRVMANSDDSSAVWVLSGDTAA